MKKIFQIDDLKKIIDEIVKHNYDANYASVIASDYFFEENPKVLFTSKFSATYNLIMDYFMAANVENNSNKFRRIVNELKLASNEREISKEEQVYILNKERICHLEKLYRTNKISLNVLKRQISKLGDDSFNLELFMESYINL